MAGIGFTLRRVLRDRSLSSAARAYGAGALVSCGPWALSILSLALIGIGCRGRLERSQVDLFFAIVTNVYALSLIVTGPLQLIVTRYIADIIYLRRQSEIFPNLLGALLCTFGGLYALAAPIAPRISGEPLVWIGFLALLGVVGSIWITMLFISATRRYERILHAFLVGAVVSVLAAGIGAQKLGLVGLLWGFIIGQAVLLYSLMTVIALEFERGRGLRFAFLGHFKLHPRLAFVGLFFNLAIWIDKILFWHHPVAGIEIAGFLHMSPVYDLPAFLAYVSIIPGMAFFTVCIETDLATAYVRYFDQVLHHGPLVEIRAIKRQMAGILGSGAGRLLHIQGVLCLVLVLSAAGLVRWLGLDWVHLPVLRVHLVAVLPQMLMVVAITTLYFFDAQRESLIMTATYLIVNTIATAATLALGPGWYGYGLALGATAGAATGLLLANRVIADLEFVTFTRQPLRASSTSVDEERSAA